MKKCNNCHIKFNTIEKRCPLCGNKLEGICDNLYPDLTKMKHPIFLKFLLFLVLAAIFTIIYVDIIINKRITYSILISIFLMTGFITVRFVLVDFRKDIIGLFGIFGLFYMILAFITYFITKLTLITNYFIPLLCIFELIFFDVVAIILRKNYIRRYMKIIFINILLSLIPLILVITNLVTNSYLAYVTFGIDIVNILGLVIFDFNDIKNELKMIFRI